jgi:hypothetical protein
MPTKPLKGTVRFWPANPPQVGQPLIGEHEAEPGQDFVSSRIIHVCQTASGLEVETLNSRYLAVAADSPAARRGER